MIYLIGKSEEVEVEVEVIEEEEGGVELEVEEVEEEEWKIALTMNITMFFFFKDKNIIPTIGKLLDQQLSSLEVQDLVKLDFCISFFLSLLFTLSLYDLNLS